MEPEAVSDTPDRRHRSEIVADLVAERKRTYDLERENAVLRERIAELEAENSRLRKGLEDEGPPEQERDTVNVPRQKP